MGHLTLQKGEVELSLLNLSRRALSVWQHSHSNSGSEQNNLPGALTQTTQKDKVDEAEPQLFNPFLYKTNIKFDYEKLRVKEILFS